MGEPQWQINDLNNLSAQGKLWGIPPSILEAIAAEESGFENAGAGINAQGYGGFFGLGQHSTYPAGTATPALLSSPSESSFITQAQLAASEFASLLKSTGGNVYAAEQEYQTGSPQGFGPGDQVFKSYGIPTSLTAGSGTPVTVPSGGGGGGASGGGTSTPATTTGFDWNPFSWPGQILGGALGTGAQAVEGGLAGILGLVEKPLKAFIVNGALILFGIVVVIVGLVILSRTAEDQGGGSGRGAPGGGGSPGRARGPEGHVAEVAEEAPEAAVVA